MAALLASAIPQSGKGFALSRRKDILARIIQTDKAKFTPHVHHGFPHLKKSKNNSISHKIL
ncbi:hypothetical protein [Pontitalea aquivivens]|uniref:hypothetical protein n=1 Tax=Pontitalea aquivivens TaxID=3388663 RepID=UPI003970A084